MTSRGVAPCASWIVADECRRSGQRMSGSPAIASVALKGRITFRASIGVPIDVVKTRLHAPPQRAPANRRASHCRFRCSRNAVTTDAGSGIARRLFDVFGSIRINDPPTRGNVWRTVRCWASKSMASHARLISGRAEPFRLYPCDPPD